MARTHGLGKPKWRQGIEMPEFSGKSWKDLNDVWPISMRTSSEAYYILCGFLPAFDKIRPFVKELTGSDQPIHFRDILLLAWCSRCEEAKDGLCTEQYPFQKGINQGLRTFWIRKAKITKIGLIENVPTNTYTRAYRVTEKGRIVLRKFVELVDEAHIKLRDVWSKDVPGTKYADHKPIDKFIRRMTGDEPPPVEKKEFKIIE